jgi:hypothetical protein
MMRDKLKCTVEPLNWLIQGFFEICLSTTFFSIYLPLWSKWCCKTVTTIMWDYHTDGSRDEVFVERSSLVINLLLDLTRYVYGRGVLFKVSSLVVFCLLLFKDTAYQFWHFGFKYTEEYVSFVLKVFHPHGRDSLQGFWRTAGQYIEYFVRFAGALNFNPISTK